MKLIPLTQGKFALVDNRDYEFLSKFKWCANFVRGNWYAVRAIRNNDVKTLLKMHQALFPGVPRLDHKNKNGLDNQRHNIRPATAQQNAANRRKIKGTSSRYRGVSWSRFKNEWVAGIQFNGASKRIGGFQNERAAAKAYDAAAKLAFGEFASLNFP